MTLKIARTKVSPMTLVSATVVSAIVIGFLLSVFAPNLLAENILAEPVIEQAAEVPVAPVAEPVVLADDVGEVVEPAETLAETSEPVIVEFIGPSTDAELTADEPVAEPDALASTDEPVTEDTASITVLPEEPVPWYVQGLVWVQSLFPAEPAQ